MNDNLMIFLLLVWCLCVSAPEIFIIVRNYKDRKREKDGDSK